VEKLILVRWAEKGRLVGCDVIRDSGYRPKAHSQADKMKKRERKKTRTCGGSSREKEEKNADLKGKGERHGDISHPGKNSTK